MMESKQVFLLTLNFPHKWIFMHFCCQDFAIQQLERRINRMQGEQSNEEKLQLEAKIKELTEELEQKSHTRHMLSLQLKRLQVHYTCLAYLYWNISCNHFFFSGN